MSSSESITELARQLVRKVAEEDPAIFAEWMDDIHGQPFLPASTWEKAKGSVYLGVTWRPESSKHSAGWEAKISRRGQTHWLGTFDNELDAAVAYDIAANHLTRPGTRITNAEEHDEVAEHYRDNAITITVRYPGVRRAVQAGLVARHLASSEEEKP